MTLQRFYKDNDDNWQVTKTFKPHDLPVIAMLCEHAFSDLSMKITTNEEAEIPF